ncbi:integrase [Bradyrhizobium sp. USDA 377]
MARKIDYLFLRKGSRNWHLKLQYTGAAAEQMGRKRLEKSLGTPDRAKAEILALSYIQQHKLALMQVQKKKDFDFAFRPKYEPGRQHLGPSGERIIATDKELIYLDDQGSITKTAPNGTVYFALPPLKQQKAAVSREERLRRPDNSDDGLLEIYLSHANVTGYNAKEARATWELYKELSANTALKDATRDHGRMLAKHLMSKGLKSATVTKKIGWLNAAVNLAIEEGKLKFNPFSKVVAKVDDASQRYPLSDEDIHLIRRNLSLLSTHDQLLIRMLATTGMRLAEPFEIDHDLIEGSSRYVIVGTKTDQSKRRVPFPTQLLPYLPAQIRRPLFKGSVSAASKRLNRFLNDIGIGEPQKVVHSLRHRAQDRLRATGCPQDIRWALLGHEKKTVADGYGAGFPVVKLKRWIDKIGF